MKRWELPAEQLTAIVRELGLVETPHQALEQRLVETAADGIVIVDLSGLITFANDAAERILDLDHDAIAEHSYTNPTWTVLAVDGGPFPPDQLPVTRVLRSGEPVDEVEHAITHRDGRRVVLSINAAPLHDAEGALTGVAATIRDITSAHQANAALAARERHFRALVERSWDGVHLVNAHGTILWEGPAVQRILGYAPEDLVGQNAMEMVHPDDIERIGNALAELMQRPGGHTVAVARVRHHDGSWRWLENVGIDLSDDPAVAAVVVNYRDITERRAADEALRERDAKLRAIEDTATDAIMIFDRQGQITFVNAAAERIFGVARDEIAGRRYDDHAWRITAPDGGVSASRGLPFARVMATSAPVHGVEHAIERPDGTRAILSTSAAPLQNGAGETVGMVATVRDVTASHTATETLRRSEQETRLLFEAVQELGKSTDLHGKLTRLVDAAMRLLGAEQAEIGLLGDTGEWITYPVSRGPLEGLLGERQRLRVDDGLDGRVVEGGRPIRCDDLTLEPLARHRDLLDPHGLRAYAAAPLRHGETVLGVLVALSTRIGAFGIEDLRRLESLAALAGASIREARLLEQVQIELSERQRAEASLEKRERQLAEAQRITHLGHWEWEIDADRLTWSNELYRIFGIEPRDFGANRAAFLTLVHPNDRARVAEAIEESRWGRQPFDLDYRIVRPNGTVRVLSTLGELRRDASGRPLQLAGTAQDVTERWRRDAAQHLLAEIDRRILRDAPLDSILRFVCGQLARDFDLALAFVALCEPNGTLAIHAAEGPGAAYVEGLDLRWDDTPQGGGIAGLAIRGGEPRVADVASDPLFQPWRERALRHGLHTALTVPLISQQRAFGVLACYSSRPPQADVFDAGSVALLHAFANQVAISLQAAEQRDRIRLQTAALESAANAVLITDTDGVIQWVNPAFTRMSGYASDEVLGRTTRMLKSSRQPHDVYRRIWETILEGNTWHGELINRHKDGRHYAEEMTVTPVRDASGSITHFISIKQDVSDRQRQEEELRHLATHDPLTDLPNRTLLRDRLEQAVQVARRNGTSCALLLLDLDRFKEVNDSLGHQVGDLLLQAVGARLQSAVRAADTVARLGGDEFAVLLPGTGAIGAEMAAEKLIRVLDANFQIEGQVLVVESSVGIAIYPDHGEDSHGLLRRADAAMYAAKRLGHGPVVYTPDHDQGTPEGLALLPELRLAIERGELALHYQPKIELRSGAVNAVEALVRWPHPERGVISPGHFIPLAERTGLIHPLTRWVLTEAVRQIAAWRASDLDVPIAVNFSTRNLLDPRLPETVGDLLAAANVPASRLIVEVTESAMMVDPVTAERSLRRLAALGVRISVDDFGTGYSSLGYLKRLPVAELKVDQSFVRDLARSAGDLGIVQAAIDLGHHLGLIVVAEGVEDAVTLEALTALGCDVAQGYHFARPMPAAAIETWLRERER